MRQAPCFRGMEIFLIDQIAQSGIVLAQLLRHRTRQLISHSNEILIKKIYTSLPPMHHGTPESCSVCLLPCMFLSPFITGCLLRFFFLLFAFTLTLFLLFIYLFICFLPSKELLLKLSHQPLNLSIFCHGKKHLNLSLHLFITCHLQLLPFSTSLSGSPPLHLFMCVPNNLFTHRTPPSSDLSVLG